MQALIDFDGWRKWKDFSQNNQAEKEKTSKSLALTKKKKANRTSVGSNPGGSASTTRLAIREEATDADGVAVA
jgi:osomolarity two-component system response regulator SSK1